MSRPIDDDELITLRDASEIVFKNRVSVAVLKAQIPHNLQPSKIGRAYFVTPRQVREMVERCRVTPTGHTSGLIKNETDGPSSTRNAEIALASLQLRLKKPKQPSRNT